MHDDALNPITELDQLISSDAPPSPRVKTTAHPGPRIIAALPAYRVSVQTAKHSDYSLKNKTSTASPRSVLSASMLHSPKFTSTFHVNVVHNHSKAHLNNEQKSPSPHTK